VLLGMSLFGRASADPSPLPATVVWANAGRVYIASKAALALEAGDLVTFSSGKKTLASGTVSAVHDGALAVVLLGSGSLDGVKKLDRVRILAEKPTMRAASVLRVGFPSRPSLLFACEETTVRPPPDAPYASDALSRRSYRFVRDPRRAGGVGWPDTVLVRLFDEAADEEIALERGELDVAVFWPGELSTHMRDDPRWRDFLRGTRSRGVLAALSARDESAPFTSADSSALLSLNEEVFRGDLIPWDPATGRAVNPVSTTLSKASHRFVVDHSCPGWRTLERSLNRVKAPRPAFGEPSPLRMMYLDARIYPPDERGFLFAVRCPVVSASDLLPYMRVLGADMFADMLECGRASGK
jgi:hypothetical protein